MYYHQLIRTSIQEVYVLSRIYGIKSPTFIFNQKKDKDYKKTDFKQDIHTSLTFKKHPMILYHLSKYN